MGDNLPCYGWKVKLDHAFPEKRTQNSKPRLGQITRLLPLGVRYFVYYLKHVRGGRLPLMDYVNMPIGKQIYGAPIGGIGCGTIGRGFKGEFCRYQMQPGIYNYHVLDANQFIVTIQDKSGKTVYQQVLSPKSNPKDQLSAWTWDFPGENAQYCALYPRSWVIYDIPEHDIRLICRQISPVIPKNYKDTSLPTAAFVWTIVNNSEEMKNVSITFTFKNGYGGKEDKLGDCKSQYFEKKDDVAEVLGVSIDQNFSGMPCSYGISAKNTSKTTVSRCMNFDPNGKGNEIWDDLLEDGQLNEEDNITNKSSEIACAVCVKCHSVNPKGGEVKAEFSLVWDMPKVQFLGKGHSYKRYYTKYFGEDGAAPSLSHYTLSNYSKWEEDIEKWQQPILDDEDLPDWYKSAIFNELYFVADGGSVWFLMDDCENLDPNDPRKEYGRFAYLEGHEYRMYNTYDVHFYASFALSMLWPKLQLALQRDICDSILKEDTTSCKFLYDGKVGLRKEKNSVPHDLGDPGNEPFISHNAYPIHDVSEWRDLSSKFVLQTYRDYAIGEKNPSDLDQLKTLWPVTKIVMEKANSCWDSDGDGLIENGGCPDQTYDSWVMSGTSAYCGSLWLAALQCMVEMAELLDEPTEKEKYSTILVKAKESFETKLWNGKYYNFDSSKTSRSKVIMSDQLCGLWYLKACGITKEVFPPDHVKSALETIYDYNVLKFANGTMGAVNGMTPEGQIDVYSIQSEEAWVGVIYGLAALMLHEGMLEKGFKTAEGIYRTVYERIGMGFETPEALYEEKYYRAIGYMRPLCIWAMQLAWERRNRK